MHAAGLEPARLAPSDLETDSLTTRTRMRGMWAQQAPHHVIAPPF